MSSTRPRKIPKTETKTMPKISYPSPDYYLDPEELPSQVISTTILDGDKEKYWIWDRMLQVGLTAKGKLGFINGELTKPNVNNSPPEISAQWKRCNAMVMSWIYNTIDPKLHHKIVQKNCNTAKELYEHVRARFSFPRNLRLFELFKKMRVTRQEESESLSDFIIRFKAMSDEMEFYWEMPERGAEVITNVVQKKKKRHDQLLIFILLAGLNCDDLRNVTTRILLTEPLPDMDRVKEILIEEDDHLEYMRVMNSVAARRGGF